MHSIIGNSMFSGPTRGPSISCIAWLEYAIFENRGNGEFPDGLVYLVNIWIHFHGKYMWKSTAWYWQIQSGEKENPSEFHINIDTVWTELIKEKGNTNDTIEEQSKIASGSKRMGF